MVVSLPDSAHLQEPSNLRKKMASKIEVEVIECEIIKPSSPTPDNRRIHKLHLLDQISPAHWIPLLLFLPTTTTDLISMSQRSQLLKKTLSQTLTRFYTFAGRLKDNTAIECNDEGAEYVATRVYRPLSTILKSPNPATLTKLAASEALPREALFASPLLRVKANFFDCGGVVIGVCLSHKVGDAATMSTFINSWAAAASKSEVPPALIPQFVSSSTFPPQDSLASLLESTYQEVVTQKNIKVRRLVFPGPRIDALRSKVASNTAVRNPTRVEAVSALIWKCVVEASAASNSRGSDQRASVLAQGVNIRKTVEPPLPENAVGNLVWQYLAKNATSGGEVSGVELKDLVLVLRRAIEGLRASCKAGIGPEETGHRCEEFSALCRDAGVHRLVASTWCRFPIYEADFGWGKPVWACTNLRVANVVVMMDTRDGNGIEVMLSLREEEMELFERNQEMLEFASLDPSVT